MSYKLPSQFNSEIISDNSPYIEINSNVSSEPIQAQKNIIPELNYLDNFIITFLKYIF